MDAARIIDDTTPVTLLDDVRATRARIEAAETRLMLLAVAWADANPGDLDGVTPAVAAFREPAPGEAVWDHDDPGDDVEAHQWRGLPSIAWGAPDLFAAANHMSSAAGLAYLRDALTLRHRLPQVWARVVTGEVLPWRARRIAQAVLGQADEIAAHLDTAVAPHAHTVGQRTLDTLIDTAMLELFPEERELAQLEALDRRHVTLDETSYTHEGVATMVIAGDWVDVHDFDRAVADVAAALKRHGSTDPLDVRRSRAVGVLADPTYAAALLAATTDEEADQAEGLRARRPVALQIRLTDLALLGLDAVGYSHTHAKPVLDQLVRTWCGRPDADLTITPLVDLTTRGHTDAYRIPDTMAARIRARIPTCVFPNCQRPSLTCDLDHRLPHNRGGPTSDDNLYPLCRHHHRLKTHASWHYRPGSEPHTLTWTDPTGHEYLVRLAGSIDARGTTSTPDLERGQSDPRELAAGGVQRQ